MLKRLEIAGFKSFPKKTTLDFASAVTAIVGPNGSGKSNVAEAFRFALGEQSMKSMRGKRAEDLIFSGTHTLPRANRAAVAVVFDNSRRAFKVDFEEVSIERTVYRDGASEYAVNGSKVRLRDIGELLAGANIGESGHHIISQGEADRILLASARERREMLEDALGLKVYEFKKEEARRKLETTSENIREVNALRREIAPHLQFLEAQVEKLQKSEELAREIVQSAQEYFAGEDAYLAEERERGARERIEAAERLAKATRALGAIEETAGGDAGGAKRLDEIRRHEREVERLTGERATLARTLGQVEGALSAAAKRSAEVAREPYAKVPRGDLAALQSEVEKQADAASTLEAARAALEAVRAAIRAFVDRFVSFDAGVLADEEKSAYALEQERADLLARERELGIADERAKNALQRAREALASHDETGKELKRRILDLARDKAREEAETARLSAREEELKHLAEDLDALKANAVALVGPRAASYAPKRVPPERNVAEEHKRALERLMIRLEEAGGANEEIRAEFKQLSEREAFLARELEDLAKSAKDLTTLIGELEAELEKNFTDGLKKVNATFTEFFALMFGGGGARLSLEEPEDDPAGAPLKAGIEISVALPKKRIQSLVQLSGGERALTSIALIFAMSQVNPPPFLILDETDAALDEANSRRYGDLLESLARHSQLIVITHNRETMGRASVLYGVTMGADGVSKLLSVKFDEAVAVAK